MKNAITNSVMNEIVDTNESLVKTACAFEELAWPLCFVSCCLVFVFKRQHFGSIMTVFDQTHLVVLIFKVYADF